MTKDEIKARMKHLARKFCRRNDVYRSFDSSVGKLIEKAYLSAYFLCLHEGKHKITKLEKENAELKVDNAFYEKACEGAAMMREQLTKAKELLNEFMRISKASDEDFEHDYSELIGEAEQFLKEVSE